MTFERRTGLILESRIDGLSWDEALGRLAAWARGRESRYVTVCNVHVVVSARREQAYSALINHSDMAVPDGAPIAWMMRRVGFPRQCRISGPDLMLALCKRCSEENLPVYLYGSTESTLSILVEKLGRQFPSLLIVGDESPPFRPLTVDEDEAVVDRINRSGAAVVWVGLGCPKQERWMALHKGRINAVMIGVGAAFDYHAGTLRRAPVWMQRSGLEWLYRLLKEPRRLWRRYLETNSIFIWYATSQLIRAH